MNNSTKAIIIGCLFTAGASECKAQEGFYLSGGIGYHREKYDCPEVCFEGDQLAIAAAGYTWEFDKTQIEAEISHTSNPKVKEEGLGLNMISLSVRRYF